MDSWCILLSSSSELFLNPYKRKDTPFSFIFKNNFHTFKYIPTNKPSFDQRIRLVEDYLQKKEPLRKLASAFGISHQTLWNWVKLYKNFGRQGLEKGEPIKKRLSRDVETKVMLLKEQTPSLSIKRAKRLLNEAGIKISEKSIWRIWGDYGLVSRKEQRRKGIFSLFVQPTPELENKLSVVKKLVENGEYKSAAKIINDLPAIPESQVLREIPERFLTLRRRLDRLCLELGRIPYPQLLKKVRSIRKALEKKGYIYSSIIADFLELDALGWMRKIEDTLPVFDRLEKKLAGVKDRVLWFLFYYEKASTYISSLKMAEGLKYVKKCHNLLYSLPFPYYWEYFGDLLTVLGEYKKALFFYSKAYEKETEPEVLSRLALKMASYGYGMAGDYIDCKKMLARAEEIKKSVIFGPNYSLIKGYLSISEGYLKDATQLFLESLKNAKEGELYNYLYATYIGFANIAMALGNRKDARGYLQKALSLMKRYGIGTHTLILEGLMGKRDEIPQEFLCIVPLRLLNLMVQAKKMMKPGDYQKAIKFAKKKGIMGIFQRWILFFPEVVLAQLMKGKKTGLPRSILKFPVFNQLTPVYHLKILGNLLIYKNQKFPRARLTPREGAFLINFALRAGEPERFVILKELYQNFWPGSENPKDNLLHLLARIKKKLMLPGHLLGVSSGYGESELHNKGVYFTTDYQEFEQTLTRAKALQRAGEWGFAKKEFLQAFKLFRGEPFKKNFDDWSVDMRFRILSELENEAINFARACLEHNNKRDAKKVLGKILKIIPVSGEIKELLDSLIV